MYLRWKQVAVPLAVCLLATAARWPEATASDKLRARSVQSLMLTQIGPAADALQAAVSTISRAGVKQESPARSEAAWVTAKRSAMMLIEGAEALGTPGLPVIAQEDEDMAERGRVNAQGDASSDLALSQEIQKEIDRRPASFARLALRLKQTSQAALAASQRHDVEGLVAVGEAINHACEQCHRKYWYP